MKNKEKIWVCPQNDNHIFTEKSPTGLCPRCEDSFSFLIIAKREIETKEIGTLNQVEGDTINSIEAEYSAGVEEKFGRLIIDAEELFEDQKYEKAKEKYAAALEIFSHRDDLHDKINLCQKKMEDLIVDDTVTTISPSAEGELGLCVLLMDASGSMFKPNALEGSEENRAQIVARAAAKGIMSLKENSRGKDAYLAVYKFDHRVKPVFLKSIAEVTQSYENEEALEDFLYQSMEMEMGGETDINEALIQAYNLVSAFLKKQISVFRKPRGDKDYPVVMRPVTNRNTMDQIVVPNVRVFIYTDGMQYVDGESKELINPFLGGGDLPDSPVDILLGAFIGSEKSKGCKDLERILSDCPEHDTKQFFLIDKPEDTVELAGIFRMASGNSGFCSECVKKEAIHVGEKQADRDIPSFDDLL